VTLTVNNDFQSHRFDRRGDPDFPLRTLSIFPTNDASDEGLREFKKQANLAVSIFLFLIVCVVVLAAGKLAWTWWSSL
jgi:anaerobic C4-dicarboxylate transporter